MTTLLYFHVAAGLLLAALSVPLILGKIGPNPLYGFRVKQTLNNPAVWYPVNAYAAKGLHCLGLGTSATAVVLYSLPGITLDVYALAVLGVFLVGLAITLILSFRYMFRLTRRQQAGQG